MDASELEELGVQVSITPAGGTLLMKPLARELVAALTKDGLWRRDQNIRLIVPRRV